MRDALIKLFGGGRKHQHNNNRTSYKLRSNSGSSLLKLFSFTTSNDNQNKLRQTQSSCQGMCFDNFAYGNFVPNAEMTTYSCAQRCLANGHCNCEKTSNNNNNCHVVSFQV